MNFVQCECTPINSILSCTTGKNIFNLNKCVFLINRNNKHWTLAVVFMKTRTIQYYDSLGESGMSYLLVLLRYLQDEYSDKRPLEFEMGPPESWDLVTCTAETPRQQNGYDCGVFASLFADWISVDRPLVQPSEADMKRYRDRIALSILNGNVA
jgi:sentrin-specific protease 1